jgi:hypothetical protein
MKQMTMDRFQVCRVELSPGATAQFQFREWYDGRSGLPAVPILRG